MNIVAIGDSVILGEGAPPERGWVDTTVRRYFRSRGKARLLNLAKKGATISEVTAEMLEQCIKAVPDLVIIGVGVNDSRLRPSRGEHETVLAEFEKQAKHIFGRLKDAKIPLVLASTQVPVRDELTSPFRPDRWYKREWQPPYDKVFREAAKSTGCLLLENFSRWVSQGEQFIKLHNSDGVHPNEEGHNEVALAAIELLTAQGKETK